MSINDRTDPSQNGSLSFQLELRHPPEKVWRAITDPALLAEWLLPSVGLKLEPGTDFVFQAGPKPGWDGTVRCRLIDSEPHRLLRYAWVVGHLETVVTFTLTPTATGTILWLEHAGFKPDQKHNFGGARYGWKMMFEKLVALLEPTAPADTGRTLT